MSTRWKCKFWRSFIGTQPEILGKRPENNNKAWIKLSEAILSILGNCWEKFICSSLLARLREEFPASNARCTYNLQPDLLGNFPADLPPDITGQFELVWVWWKGNIQSFSGGGEGGTWILMWPKGKINPSVGGGVGGRGFWEQAHSSYSIHQIPSDTLNCSFPRNTFLPKTNYFSTTC